MLDPTERERHAAYRRLADADRFLLGAALVRLIASAEIGVAPAPVAVSRDCPTCPRQHGPVRLPGTDLRISVSHSGLVVAVAAGRHLVLGVDVEQLVELPDAEGLRNTSPGRRPAG